MLWSKLDPRSLVVAAVPCGMGAPRVATLNFSGTRSVVSCAWGHGGDVDDAKGRASILMTAGTFVLSLVGCWIIAASAKSSRRLAGIDTAAIPGSHA
jgi:hypothetical protein